MTATRSATKLLELQEEVADLRSKLSVARGDVMYVFKLYMQSDREARDARVRYMDLRVWAYDWFVTVLVGAVLGAWYAYSRK